MPCSSHSRAKEGVGRRRKEEVREGGWKGKGRKFNGNGK